MASSISGTLFFDNNADSKNDNGESVIPKFSVYLYSADGSTRIASTTSSGNGVYSFSGVAAGTYTVVFPTTSGYRADQGVVDASGYSRVAGVTVGAGQALTLDQGFYQAGSVAGTVYGSSGQGVDGVTLDVVDGSGTVLATKTTATVNNKPGSYSVAGLPVGSLSVQVVPSAGAAPTAPAAVTLKAPGQVVAGVNLNLPGGAGGITGNLYFDPNGNDVKDSGEGGIPGFPVDLYAADGTTLLASTASDANGDYSFANLAAGNYLLKAHTGAGYVPDQGTVAADGSSWIPVSVAGGQTMVKNDGFYVGNAFLYGYVTAAGNGGSALSGVTVNLLNRAGAVVASTTTNGSGLYDFNGLQGNTYGVQVVPPQGLSVADGPAVQSRSMGFAGPAQFANVSLASQSDVAPSLSGTVYLDTDGDHQLGPGEPGVAGANVALVDATGAVVATATTDAQGGYTIANPIAGSGYKVIVSPPAGYVGEDGPGTAATGIAVVAGQATTGADIGLKPDTSSTATLNQTTPAPATTVLNVIVRGQSNTYFPTVEGETAAMGKQIEQLLGFDGVHQRVNVVAVPSVPNGTGSATEWSGTSLTTDWLTQNGGNYQNGWSSNTIERSYLSALSQIPQADQGAPTAILMLHNEFDSSLSNMSTAEWTSAMRYEAGLARAALGLSAADSPYLFVSPIPFAQGSATEPLFNQDIAVGQAQLSSDPTFNAKVVTLQSSDVTMNHDGTNGGYHLNTKDQQTIYGRAALGIAEEFASSALPGSPVALADGNIDSQGPQVTGVQSVARQPNQLLLTVAFDQASSLQNLSAVAAAGTGWTLRQSAQSATPDASATAAQVVGQNQLLLTFDNPVPSGDRLFYTWGSLRLQQNNGTGNGNAVYDDKGLPLAVDPTGLPLAPAAQGSSTLYTMGGPAISGTVAGQVTVKEAPVAPFGGVTVKDPNAGAIDRVTIALSGGGGTLQGAGLIADNDGTYSLSGSAAAVSAALRALSFAPTAGSAAATPTNFAMSVQSSAYVTAATDVTTSVIDRQTPVAPAGPTPAPGTPAGSTSTGQGAVGSPGSASPPAPILTGQSTPQSTGSAGNAPIDTLAFDPDAKALGRGAFLLTGHVASIAGVSAVEITATVDGTSTDLGPATVAADGTFAFVDRVGAHTQGFIGATATDGAGGTVTAQASFDLTAGVTGSPYGATQDHYDPASEAYTGTTYYKGGGREYYDASTLPTADGGSSTTYSGGTFFQDKDYTAFTDTLTADGTLVVHSEANRDGTHAVSVLAPGRTVTAQGDDAFDATGQTSTAFVFQPGFGQDLVTGFLSSGRDHDVLTLSGSAFTSLAQVLHDTRDTSAGAVITDHATGDTITLADVSKAELAAHPRRDFTLTA